MPDPNAAFPVDAPELPAPTNSEVPHDEVQASLADALGVSAEDVKGDAAPKADEAIDPNDLPLSRPLSEIMAERKAKLDNQTLPRDPSVTPRKGDTITPPEFWPAQGSPSRLASSNPNAPQLPGIGDVPRENPSWLDGAFAEGQDAGYGAASPGPSPFRERAEVSQRIKRLLRSPVMVEIEGEGLDHLAQIVAKIMTTHDAEAARAAWNELARLCDDVAAALR